MGGVLALGMAQGTSPDELVRWLRSHAATFYGTPASWPDPTQPDDAERAGITEQALQEVCGKAHLTDLPRRVLIPAVKLDASHHDGTRAWKVTLFHNFPGVDADNEERLVDVAQRACATPTFAPAYQGFIDGSIICNNPSMAALSQAIHPQWGVCEPTEIRLLSLGSGRSSTFIESSTEDWGLVQWARPLLALSTDGTADLADFQCQQLLAQRYHRLNPPLPFEAKWDDVGSLPELIRLAEEYSIDAAVRWITEYMLRDS